MKLFHVVFIYIYCIGSERSKNTASTYEIVCEVLLTIFIIFDLITLIFFIRRYKYYKQYFQPVYVLLYEIGFTLIIAYNLFLTFVSTNESCLTVFFIGVFGNLLVSLYI